MSWLIANRHTVAIFCLIALVVGFSAAFDHYRNESVRQAERANAAEQQLAQAVSTISHMKRRQQAVAELDVRYTQELADAKNTIERLRNDVAAGKRRLQLNAKCQPVRESSSAPGVDDAGAAELTPDAQRDYYRHRGGIVTVDKMIRGLQKYIRTQCQK